MLSSPLGTSIPTNSESDFSLGFERAYLLSIINKGIDGTHAAFEYNGKCFQVVPQTGDSQAQATNTECHEHWLVSLKEPEHAAVDQKYAEHYCVVVNLPTVKAFAKSLHVFFSNKKEAEVEGRVCEIVRSMPSNCIDERAINDPTQIRRAYIQSVRILGQWATHQTFYFGQHQFSLSVDGQGDLAVKPSTDITSDDATKAVKRALNNDTTMAEASEAEHEWAKVRPFENLRLSILISLSLLQLFSTRLKGENQWLGKPLTLSYTPIPEMRTFNATKKAHEFVKEFLKDYDNGNFKIGLALLDAFKDEISEEASGLLRLDVLREGFVFKMNNQVKLVRMLKEKVSSLPNISHKQLSHDASLGIKEKDLSYDMIEVRVKKNTGTDIWRVISKSNLFLEIDSPLNPINLSLLSVDDLRAVSLANLTIASKSQTPTRSIRRGSF